MKEHQLKEGAFYTHSLFPKVKYKCVLVKRLKILSGTEKGGFVVDSASCAENTDFWKKFKRITKEKGTK